MQRFPDKSRVCFVGDSITHDNVFLAHIVGYYKEHFPDAMVEFYNCGFSGASLTTILNLFNDDVVPFEPTHIVLMIGINDSFRSHLARTEPNFYEQLLDAYKRYEKNLNTFFERVKGIGAELILCTPTPYAEYMKSDVEPLKGAYALTLGYAEFVKSFAKDHNLALCDYHSYITRELTLSQKPLYHYDHVHPCPLGHYYMAKCFLEFQGLELGESQEIPEAIVPWHKTTSKLRNMLKVEKSLFSENPSISDEEKIEAVEKIIQSPEEYNYSLYLTNLIRAYPDTKRRQKEYFEFIKNFMKCK